MASASVWSFPILFIGVKSKLIRLINHLLIRLFPVSFSLPIPRIETSGKSSMTIAKGVSFKKWQNFWIEQQTAQISHSFTLYFLPAFLSERLLQSIIFPSCLKILPVPSIGALVCNSHGLLGSKCAMTGLVESSFFSFLKAHSSSGSQVKLASGFKRSWSDAHTAAKFDMDCR